MTRVEQFRKKWNRNEQDYMQEMVGKKALDDKYEVKNVDKLLEEAAAVFSIQGLQTLTNLVTSKTENTVNNVLEQQVLPKIEQIVESKLHIILSGMVKGLEAFTAHLQSHLPDGPAAGKKDLSDQTNQPVKKVKGKTIEQAEIVIAKLKEMTAPIRLPELIKITPEIEWTNNPHVKIMQMMKIKPEITRTGFGLYEYREIS